MAKRMANMEKSSALMTLANIKDNRRAKSTMLCHQYENEILVLYLYKYEDQLLGTELLERIKLKTVLFT
jgi:hypothetical protein